MPRAKLPEDIFRLFESKARAHPRSNAVKNAIQQEWAGKTAGQRTSIVACIKAVQAAATDVRALLQEAQRLRDVALNSVPAADPQTVMETRVVLEAVEEAIRVMEELHDLQRNLTRAWRRLLAVQHRQGMGAESTAYSTSQRNLAQDGLSTTLDEISAIQDIQDKPPLPAYPPGTHKMPEKWISKRRLQAFRAEKTQLDSRKGDVGLRDPGRGTWVARRDLKGGMSNVTVWLNYNDDGTIQDQVVRKDTYMSNSWTEATRFCGDITNEATRLPWEMVCHQALRDVAGLHTVVRLRVRLDHGLVFNDQMMYRLYLEWCPHSDLFDLIANHKGADTPIPERFCWYVVECLAKAGVAMEHGGLGAANWEEIVHRYNPDSNVCGAC